MNQEEKEAKEQLDLKAAIDQFMKGIGFLQMQLLEAKKINGFCIILDYVSDKDEVIQPLIYKATNSLNMLGLLEVFKADIINDYRGPDVDDLDEDDLEDEQ